MSTTLKVGAQFQKNQAHPWTDADGGKHFHSFVTLCEVTDVNSIGIGYTVVEVLEEVGRPTEGDIMIPTAGKSKGSMTYTGLVAAIKRGSVVPLAADHVVGSRIVARFSHAQQAADSAVLRTARSTDGTTYTAEYDAVTDTHVVVNR